MLEQIRRFVFRERNARRVQLRESGYGDDMQYGAAPLQLFEHVMRWKTAYWRGCRSAG